MVKKIDGYLEFGQEIILVHFSSTNMRIVMLLNLINGLSFGCGCSRQARVMFVSKDFREVCSSLRDIDKAEIKTFFGVENVEIMENGATFCMF